MFYEALRTNDYTVSIGGNESPPFTRVSGLSEGEIEAIEQPDGGSVVVHKISSGIVKFDDLTLERYMDGSKYDIYFFQWFRDMFSLDGAGRGSTLRRNGSIIVRRFQQEFMRFAFEGAWMRSSKFTDLQAGGSELMKQTIVLAVDRLVRVEPIVLPMEDGV